MSNPKSDIDWMILDAKSKPAPGSYDIKLPSSSGSGSGKFAFVWKPTDPALQKFAKGINRIKDINRMKRATSTFGGIKGQQKDDLLSVFKASYRDASTET